MHRISMLSDHLTSSLQSADTPQSLTLAISRPRVLNALNQAALTDLHNALSRLGDRTLILQGEGKGFCAGGDVVHLCTHPEDCPDFFRSEFSLLYRIHSRSNFSVALMKGPTMGGGAGLSFACKARVATNTTLWAFPETVIGFVPDVGANFLLSRLASRAVGLFLALTGERLNGADCFYLGIATHYVDDSKLSELVQALASSQHPLDTLALFHQSPDRGLCSIFANIEAIESAFSGVATIEELCSRLNQQGTEWAKKTLATLHFMCPLSLKVELRLFALCSSLSYSEVLEQEYDVNIRMTSVNNTNFLTGVRHRLVQKEKARAPWTPSTLAEVSEDLVLDCLRNPDGPKLNTAAIRG